MSQKITIEEMLNDPDVMINALVALKEERIAKINAQLEAKEAGITVGEDSTMSTKINISTTALKKCGLIDGRTDCRPPSDLISLCVSYLSIDEKQTKAEMFDALCKRLEDHFNINPLDTSMN